MNLFGEIAEPKIKGYRKVYYQRNKTQSKAYRQINAEKIKAYGRAYYILKYGITVEQYNQKLISQNNLCAICKNKETRKSKKCTTVHRLSIDHNHATGKNRGLLCGKCNSGIEYFKENIQTLESAIKYLKSYQ